MISFICILNILYYVEHLSIRFGGDRPSTNCNVFYNVLCLEYSVVLIFIC